MDRAYEGDDTRQLALDLGYVPVVPPKRNRLDPWDYDRAMYRKRNEVERLFRRLKGFRRVFSRFDKLGGCTEEVERLIELLQPQSPAIAQTHPVDRYIILYAEAEELLYQLREQHEGNYGIEPSQVDWGDVGSLSNFVEVLQFAVRSLPNRPK